MKVARLSVLIAALGMAFPVANLVHAKDVKFPKENDPAFIFTVPGDWKNAPDEAGNLRVTAANESCALSLSMIQDPKSARLLSGDPHKALDVLYRAIFNGAKIDDSNRRQDVEIAGRMGTAYIGTTKNPQGEEVNVTLILVKVDDNHAASLTMVTTQTISSEDRDVLEKVLKSMKFTEAK